MQTRLRELRLPKYGVLLCFFVIWTVPALAQKTCYDDQARKALVGQQATQSIFYDFGSHRGSTQPLKIFESILTDPNISVGTIHKAVADLKRGYADFLQQQSKRAERIKTLLLSESDKISWISPEGYTPLTFTEKNNNGFTRSERHILLRAKLVEKGVAVEDVEQMLLLMDGPLVYVWQSSSQIQARVRLEGLEDVKIDEVSTKLINFMVMVIDGLEMEVPGLLSRPKYDQLVKTFDQATSKYVPVSKSEIDSLVSGIENKLISATVFVLLEKTNEFIALNAPREAAIVNSMQVLKGNGLIQFGGLHENGIKHIFLSSCQNAK